MEIRRSPYRQSGTQDGNTLSHAFARQEYRTEMSLYWSMKYKVQSLNTSMHGCHSQALAPILAVESSHLLVPRGRRFCHVVLKLENDGTRPGVVKTMMECSTLMRSLVPLRPVDGIRPSQINQPVSRLFVVIKIQLLHVKNLCSKISHFDRARSPNRDGLFKKIESLQHFLCREGVRSQ
jgi:hypothetical protein